MAMTLRLPDDLDEQLSLLADAQGVSKQQLLVRAARDLVDREFRNARTLANVDRIVSENTGLLDRLSR